MSAIFGIIDFEERPIETSWIKSMKTNLSHRGPEGQRIYQEKSMFFGHMLLQITPESIYDTSPYEEDGFIITANARLDERDAIMDRLNVPTLEREAITDPLLLLRSFLKFGKNFIKDIYGDFSFAIWDKEKKELYCARDQMGVKPFLYYFEDNRFVFSTELKAIIKLPFVKTKINHIYNRDRAVTFNDQVDKTQWVNINRLKAANSLSVQNGNILLKEYWDLKYKPNRKIYKSEEKAANKLLNLLELAISDRMRVIGDIGVPLSGGLDSSAIACIAARKQQVAGKKLITISSVLDPEFSKKNIEDEQTYINAVVQQEKNIEPTYVYSSKLSFLKGLNEKFENHYDVVNIFHYVDKAIYEQLQSKSIRRILSGFTGDHIISTDINPLPHLLRDGRFVTFYNLANKIKSNENLNNFSLFRKYILNPIIPFFIRNLWIRHKGLIPFWDIEEFPIVLNDQEKQQLKQKTTKHAKAYYKFRKNIFNSMWPKDEDPFMEDWDCGSSMHQIEMTYPLADRRIVEFMQTLPIEHFLAGGIKRGLIRKALVDVYPTIIKERQNKGPYSPAYRQVFINSIDEIKIQLKDVDVKTQLETMFDINKLIKHLDLLSNSKKNITFDPQSVYLQCICAWLTYTIWSIKNKKNYGENRNTKKAMETS